MWKRGRDSNRPTCRALSVSQSPDLQHGRVSQIKLQKLIVESTRHGGRCVYLNVETGLLVSVRLPPVRLPTPRARCLLLTLSDPLNLEKLRVLVPVRCKISATLNVGGILPRGEPYPLRHLFKGALRQTQRYVQTTHSGMTSVECPVW